jgi:hypothetical protein
VTDHDAIEAVTQALERQMSQPVGAEYHRPEPITEVTRGSRADVAQNVVKAENASHGVRPDSLVKARYASTVLRVAQTTDTNTAARLIRGLMRDLPHPNELPQISEIHLRAINSFIQLASSLNPATNSERQSVWKAALDATADWLRALEAKQ